MKYSSKYKIVIKATDSITFKHKPCINKVAFFPLFNREAEAKSCILSNPHSICLASILFPSVAVHGLTDNSQMNGDFFDQSGLDINFVNDKRTNVSAPVVQSTIKLILD